MDWILALDWDWGVVQTGRGMWVLLGDGVQIKELVHVYRKDAVLTFFSCA